MSMYRRILSHVHTQLLSRQCPSTTQIPAYLRRNVRGSRFTGTDDSVDPEAGIDPGECYEGHSDGPQVSARKRRFRPNVPKLLRNSATYEACSKDFPQFSDPFMSGPYTKGTIVPGDVKAENKEDKLDIEVHKIDPVSRSIILFPGDGTQYLKMCGNPDKFPEHLKVLYDIASGVLEIDLLDLIINGPVHKLHEPRYSQPAIVVTSLAALEQLRDFDPLAVQNCAVTAGFGLGEVAALVFAGAMNYEDAVRFAYYRGQAMQLASQIVPGGLATVFYGADSKLGSAMQYAEEWCRREYGIENPVCAISHYLFPHCKVIGGHQQALDFIQMNYKEFKLRKVKRLKTPAAFHTPLMKAAAEPLFAFMKNVELNPLRIPVYGSARGSTLGGQDHIKRELCKQVYLALRWEQTLQRVYQRPRQDDRFPKTYECGPGKSLRFILKSVNRKAAMTFDSIAPDFRLNIDEEIKQQSANIVAE